MITYLLYIYYYIYKLLQIAVNWIYQTVCRLQHVVVESNGPILEGNQINSDRFVKWIKSNQIDSNRESESNNVGYPELLFALSFLQQIGSYVKMSLTRH